MTTEISTFHVDRPDAGSRKRGSSQLQKGGVDSQSDLRIALLTGGQDRHYSSGLAMALMEQNVSLDVVGSNDVDGPELHGHQTVRFLNVIGDQSRASFARKIVRIAFSYGRLMRYIATQCPKTVHILWNGKLELFDRTILMLYLKVFGKKIVLTAHNVNAARRDAKDSWLNRVTLLFQYSAVDHIFVHTQKMKDELLKQFRVSPARVTIIPYGMNNVVPYTRLTPKEARQRLGIHDNEKVILFFGAIKPYKGLQYLVSAFQQILSEHPDLRLVIAGERKKGYEEYFRAIERTIDEHPSRERVIQCIEFIPDEEAEIYFKAADVAALPYTEIFQSGILFMSFSFGLPAIATDVGSFSEDILEGENGFICAPCDADSLAKAILRYFESDLFLQLKSRRQAIREFAISAHSWSPVGEITRDVYARLLSPRKFDLRNATR